MPERVHQNPNLIFSVGTQVDLINRKTRGPEKGRLEKADLDFHQREYERLRAQLVQDLEESKLPEAPTGAAALDDLLIRLRLKGCIRKTPLDGSD